MNAKRAMPCLSLYLETAAYIVLMERLHALRNKTAGYVASDTNKINIFCIAQNARDHLIFIGKSSE